MAKFARLLEDDEIGQILFFVTTHEETGAPAVKLIIEDLFGIIPSATVSFADTEEGEDQAQAYFENRTDAEIHGDALKLHTTISSMLGDFKAELSSEE